MAVRIEKGGWILIFLVGAGLASYSLHRYGLLDLSRVFGDRPQRSSAPKGDSVDPSQPLPAKLAAETRAVRVRLNLWVGCAGGLVANGGLETRRGSIYNRKGLDVSFRVIDDWDESATALADGNVDMMLTTADVWAKDFAQFREKGFNARAFLLVDWSRGADGVIGRQGIDSIEDLAGKRVAFAPNTPSHFLLWNGLKNSGLATSQVNDIFNNSVHTEDGIDPATLFVKGRVDAAAAWDPDMSDAVAKRPGSKKVYDTRTANRLIADVLVVGDTFAKRSPKTVIDFAEGWLEGVEFIKENPTRAYTLIGTMKEFNIPADMAKTMLEGVRLADYADNRQFFGTPGQESDYSNIFNMAQQMYRELRVIKHTHHAEQSLDRRYLDNIADRGRFSALSTEPAAQYRQPSQTAVPIATQRRFIYFEPNSAVIGAESYPVVDELGNFMRAYQNTTVQIEAKTDARGSRDLSKDRAEAVKSYLTGKFGFPGERIRTAGNGRANGHGDTEIRVYVNEGD